MHNKIRNPRRWTPARLLVSGALVLVVGAGCRADVAALEARRERLDAEVLAREVLLAELESAGTDGQTLVGVVEDLRRGLSVVDVRALAAGLHEEGASGRMETLESGESRILLEGPGPSGRSLDALAIAAERAGGLVLERLSVEPRGWKAECVLAPPPPFEPVDDAAPELPPAPRGLLEADSAARATVIALEARLSELDARLGVDYRTLERKRFEYGLLRRHGEQPDRLGRMLPALRRLLGGPSPVLEAVVVRWDDGHGEVEGRLVAGNVDELEGARLGWHQLVDVKVEGAGDGVVLKATLLPAS